MKLEPDPCVTTNDKNTTIWRQAFTALRFLQGKMGKQNLNSLGNYLYKLSESKCGAKHELYILIQYSGARQQDVKARIILPIGKFHRNQLKNMIIHES
jgi:hypothetical protein